MARADFADRHLSDLHALAAQAGVERYRLLRRDELIERLEEAGVEPPEPQAATLDETSDAETEPAAAAADREADEGRPRRRGRRGGRGRGREREGEERDGDADDREDGPTEPVTGVLDILPQRYGFLRLSGLEAGADDVYISASQIRRCELKAGDEVSGPAREPGRGERYRALVHVDTVNGEKATEEDGRQGFEELTPVPPTRRMAIEPDAADVLTRAVDLLVPLAFGQRVLVRAAPRSGRTTLLRNLAGAIARGAEDATLIVLLVDERPEEATRWREALPGIDVAAATADMGPRDQARVAETALARAKRLAESGRDAVLLVDSLSRLAVARDAATAKTLFGAGRAVAEEGAGSLTVVATALEGGEDEGDALRLVETTENAVVQLDPELAAAGVYPAIAVAGTRASGEEELRDPDELRAVRALRDSLAGLDPRVVADELRRRIEGSASNRDLLASL
jgi:transcription termination factor Rho